LSSALLDSLVLALTGGPDCFLALWAEPFLPGAHLGHYVRLFFCDAAALWMKPFVAFIALEHLDSGLVFLAFRAEQKLDT